MKTNEVQNLLSTVKTLLKNRSMNYSAFAALMGMSESGVKKMLNGEDCSMSRLIQVSNVLGVPLHELLKLSNTNEPHTIRLTPVQQDYFVENMPYFYFYATLVEHLYSRDAIQEVTGLSDASTDLYLRQLNSLGLFPLAGDGRLEVCPAFIADVRSGRGVSLFVGPKVNRCIRELMCARMFDTANTFSCAGSDLYDAETLAKISEAFVQRRLSLTVDSIDALRVSLRALINTYSERASIERATHPPE